MLTLRAHQWDELGERLCTTLWLAVQLSCSKSIFNYISISLSLSLSPYHRYCAKQLRQLSVCFTMNFTKFGCLNLPGQRRQDDVCRSGGTSSDPCGDASMAITQPGSRDVERTPLTRIFLIGWVGPLHLRDFLIIYHTYVSLRHQGNFSVGWPWTIHVLFCLASSRLKAGYLLIWTVGLISWKFPKENQGQTKINYWKKSIYK